MPPCVFKSAPSIVHPIWCLTRGCQARMFLTEELVALRTYIEWFQKTRGVSIGRQGVGVRVRVGVEGGGC